MEVASLLIGILGTVVSVFALIYAAMAAHRSEVLLKRLVVYPFRELDIAFARLNASERRALMSLYRKPGASSAEGVVIARTEEADHQVLRYLAREQWLIESPSGDFEINKDRLPYFSFLAEAEREAQ